MKYYMIHTYDRGDVRWERIVGPRFKTQKEAFIWRILNPKYFQYIADYKIKEHTK